VIPAQVPDAQVERALPISVPERDERRVEAVDAGVVVTRAFTREIEATVAIRSEADIVAARQHGRSLASRLGFSVTEATLVATAISELARNIILYAEHGSIVMKPLHAVRGPGVLVVAHDDGPGISDLRRALAGGFSTSGGLGLGLCGVRRLVDDFDVESEPGRGTRVTFKKWRA
jgi:serine/threonine-protein kinase RsbT